MNLAEFAIKKNKITIVLTLLILVGGILTYQKLGKLKDPTYTIKTAVIYTQYPGATPKEVENEVTDIIETSVQRMDQVKKIRSVSSEGLSIVYVEIKDHYRSKELPQIWNELRRKVSDVQGELPPGAIQSLVNDDYGDVYGIFFGITGDGYSYRELKDVVNYIKKKLLLVKDVAKISIIGEQHEAIYIDFSQQRLAKLGFSREYVYNALRNQNLIVTKGKAKVGNEYIRIDPSGAFESIDAIKNLLIKSPASESFIYLKDIAKVSRGYITPPRQIVRYNGQKALGFGISTVKGGNVVKMGEAVKEKLKETEGEIPVGIHLGKIAYQSDTVQQSVNGFMLNLVEALAIVIGLLMIFMGLASGILIGIILLLTILATFITMYFLKIDVQCVSIGALIIALGMLVDNAIVITEGIQVKIQQGKNKIESAAKTFSENNMALLGATVIAILAFAAIGLSQDTTGEYCRSLFLVVAISLGFSYVFAVTVTPLLCVMMIKNKNSNTKSPYNSRFFRSYRNILVKALNHRWKVIIVMFLLLITAVCSFSFVKQAFFPGSVRPQFMIDFWNPQGTYIFKTSEDLYKMEKFLLKQKNVTDTAAFIGGPALRFILNYIPEDYNSSYGQIIVTVKDSKNIGGLIPKIKQFAAKNYPDAQLNIKRFAEGITTKAKIEARFKGPDPVILRQLSDATKEIMSRNKNSDFIRDNWRQQVKILEPVFAEINARKTGITRPEMINAIRQAYNGTQAGLYRDEGNLLPILLRTNEKQNTPVDELNGINIWSQVYNKSISLSQIVTDIKTIWENPLIHRRDRVPTITVQCEPKNCSASELFEQLRPKIENIKLPLGYSLIWGGEYHASSQAKDGLMKTLPLTFIFMMLIVIILFNAFKQPIIIFLILPLSIIGITTGLLLLNAPFNFMALLGFLSLSGMLIKNGIVLIDRIDADIKEGKDGYTAILDSSVCRFRPVLMAALTTVLGMFPLIFDVLYESMAVTIMFGLTFATILTLIVVPVFYSLFFKYNKKVDKQE
jgi:multidrug efflux pump subunit AcrB